MAENPVTPELLKRYLERECTPEETEKVEQWYLSADRTGAEVPEFNEVMHLIRVRKAIRESEAGTNDIVPLPIRISVVLRYATAAIVLLVCGLGLYFYTSRPVELPDIPVIASPVVVSNSQKQMLRHHLPDGSTIWLHPGSELRYLPAISEASQREVSVHGEAFFEVAKDDSRPFTVVIDDLRVRVLGTSFHIKATPGLSSYEVTVVTGKVRVYSARQASAKEEVVLLPAQKAVFEVASGMVTSSEMPVQNSVLETWQPASLDFEDARLLEVARRLEQKFGVSVQLEDPKLTNCLLKATFENLRLVEILEAVSAMLELTYEINGNAIVLKGNGCE